MENKEKYIIDSIRDHREHVDTSDLWASIESEIQPPKKKRRPIIWLWLLIGILSAGLIGYGLDLFTSPTENNLAINTIESKTTLNTEDKYSEIKSKNYEEMYESDVEIQEDSDIKNNKTNTSNTTLHNPHVSTTKHTQNTLHDTRNSNKANNERNANGPAQQSLTLAETLTPAITANPSNLPPNAQSNTANQTNSTNEANYANLANKANNANNPNLANTANKANTPNFSFPFLESILSKLEYDREDIILPLVAQLPKEEETLNKANPWTFALQSGYVYSNRSLNASFPLFESSAAYRNSIEEQLGGFEINATLGYSLGKFNIASGISFLNLVELSQFQSTEIREVSSGQGSVIYYLDGSTSITNDPTYHAETYTLKRYNSARFISIPLRVSYQFLSIGKLDLAAGIEAQYNLQFKYLGQTGLEDGVSYVLSEDVEGRFKNKNVHQYGAFLAASYPITNTSRGFASLGYSKTNSISTDNYLIDQHYNLFKFSAGYQWLF